MVIRSEKQIQQQPAHQPPVQDIKEIIINRAAIATVRSAFNCFIGQEKRASHTQLNIEMMDGKGAKDVKKK